MFCQNINSDYFHDDIQLATDDIFQSIKFLSIQLMFNIINSKDIEKTLLK